MWRIVSIVVVVCVVCLFSIKAQTVNESESSIILNEKMLDVSLVLENLRDNLNDKIALELLDSESKIRSQTAQNLDIKKGKHFYKLSLPLGDWVKSVEDELSWFRLRYRVGTNEGIISISELLKDDFHLRAAAGNVFKPGTNYRLRIRALKPFTENPVSNVQLEASLKLELNTDEDEDELILTAAGKTNAEGFALIDFKIPENRQLEEGGKLKIVGIKNNLKREIEEEVDSIDLENTIFLSTDKPIYQPGQKFNVRGLYFDSNQNSVSNGELEFKIYDEDDTVLYREKVTTSAFGIASISWQIPENAKLGTYRVKIESEEELGENSIRFKVTRYDLPNFSVNPKLDKTFYLPSDKFAEIAVRADYLFGKPVTKGKVRVVQESEREWNYKEQKYDVEEKQSFEGEIDADGKFIAKADLSKEFEDLLDDKSQRFEDLHFVSYFTDLTTNKTEQKRFDVRLTKEPIHVYLLGYSYGENTELPFVAYVSTFYADGTPAVCNVEIKGKYEDSKDIKTLTQIKTNSLGAGKAKFLIPSTVKTNKDFELKIIARDAKQSSGTFEEEIDSGEGDAVKIETEKTIFKPGEPFKVSIISTKKDALIYFDVIQDWAILDSYSVKLKNGRAELKIPYNPNFKGNLTLAAYTDESSENYYYDGMKATRGIIFPAPQNLKLSADFTSPTYKPNEEAQVNFSIASGDGKAIESALGVVVFDKAIEERARTDAEFGSYFSRFYRLMGYEKSFGGITLKDLNNLDLSKPISGELQLAAEIMLADDYFSPQIYRTEENPTKAKFVYAEFFKRQFTQIEVALKKQFEADYSYPTDDLSLRKILSENGIDFNNLRDPWNQLYRPIFSIKDENVIVAFETAGANKKFGDYDDFSVSTITFAYFTPFGKKIDKAVKDYHARTGNFIRDEQTLRAELLRQDFDLNSLKDRWNHNYYVTFDVQQRNYLIGIHSNGANGLFEPQSYSKDDFKVWTNATDYFAEKEKEINEILNRSVNRDKNPFPQNETDFKTLLKKNGVDIDALRDGYGNPIYLIFDKTSKYTDKTTIENGKQKITPVTQETISFSLKSKGENLTVDYDDFQLAIFSSIITEKSKDTLFSRADIRNIATSGANGAIRGTVSDATNVRIANAEITATNEADATKIFTTTSDNNGEFLLPDLPSGFYKVETFAFGFQKAIYTNIRVQSQNVVEMIVALQIGTVNETVDVTSTAAIEEAPKGRLAAMSLMDVKLGAGGGGGAEEKEKSTLLQQDFTPRLREYFPETLVWSPELLTDKNGKAQLKFKIADNITTWKLYTIASTKTGKIGIAEKEIQAFQPFFVDLDPPKFLTEADEIYLPAQVRNYTDKKQKVGVSMAKSDWFSFLNQANQTVDVAPGSSVNAVFGFKTLSAIKDGKQRVTAIAAKDSDAIEKPVTVRPNGQEIVKTDSRLFQNAASFDVNFPADALPKTQKAELKIYPNLMAHVTESVEGLLQRPYGCGEQTVSSTYPNLMILKFTKEDSKLRPKAQKYLQKGYEKLLGYQTADGGFSYWGGKDEADLALTAYAIRFLTDAKSFIAVDEDTVKRAKEWLIKQQRADGSFTRKYYYETSEDTRRTKLFTAYMARTLAMLKEKDSAPLQKALAYLKTKNAEIDEPYALSLFALASFDSGNTQDAQAIIEKLEKLAIPEGEGVYWNLETNTPFYGWGTAGRIETTALAVQSLIKAKAENKNANNGKLDELISKGTLFLLKNKDRYGVWYSTQTTINVLDAFLAALAQTPKSENQTLQVFLNGKNIQNISVSTDKIEPIILNLDDKINSANNRIEIKSSNDSPVMAQIVAAHYIDWKNADFSNQTANQSRALRLDYKCDKQSAKIMEEVSCAVSAERIGFQGYGMLLAEIGIPPGADVSRESLQEAMKNDWSLNRYDVLPDRIILYVSAKAGGTKFDFKFKPRYAINAQTPSSVVYDYYNEEAKATIKPIRFNIK